MAINLNEINKAMAPILEEAYKKTADDFYYLSPLLTAVEEIKLKTPKTAWQMQQEAEAKAAAILGAEKAAAGYKKYVLSTPKVFKLLTEDELPDFGPKSAPFDNKKSLLAENLDLPLVVGGNSAKSGEVGQLNNNMPSATEPSSTNLKKD